MAKVVKGALTPICGIGSRFGAERGSTSSATGGATGPYVGGAATTGRTWGTLSAEDPEELRMTMTPSPIEAMAHSIERPKERDAEAGGFGPGDCRAAMGACLSWTRAGGSRADGRAGVCQRNQPPRPPSGKDGGRGGK